MNGISVALCTYNGDHYLEEQLSSILSQSLTPDEVVVSDDGSTDGTVALVRRVAIESSVPIRLIAGPRRGVTANFEHAVHATTGDLIALCDQDDVWHPDHLARLAEEFRRTSRLMVSSNARLVDYAGVPTGGTLFQSLRLRADEVRGIRDGRAFSILVRRNVVTGATAMLRRDLVRASSPFPRTWLHDEWLALVAASRDGIAILDDVLLDYRQHGANQVGARRLSVPQLVARLVQTPGDRYSQLSLKWADAADFAASSGWDQRRVAILRNKAAFERSRSRYPRSRLRRFASAVPHLMSGDYRRFASQGVVDIARDLLVQRAI